MQNLHLFALKTVFYNWVICLYLFSIYRLIWDKNLKNDTWFWTQKKHICRCADKYRNNGSNKQLADHLQIETLLPWRGSVVFKNPVEWTSTPCLCLSLGINDQLCSLFLLAPAAGKTLSSGQLIRITGISPLRGSLRAVSGSTIIILAVIAYMRSCLMVCDGILAQPLLFQEGHRVPHKWLSTRTDVSVLAYSIFNVQQRSLI